MQIECLWPASFAVDDGSLATSSADPSIDELLLSEENHRHMHENNFFVHIKPIGAERKIGQPSATSSQSTSSVSSSSPPSISLPLQQQHRFPIDLGFESQQTTIAENDRSSLFETPLPDFFTSFDKPSTTPIYHHSSLSPIQQSFHHQTNSDLIHRSFDGLKSGSSTTHSSRSRPSLNGSNQHRQAPSLAYYSHPHVAQSISGTSHPAICAAPINAKTTLAFRNPLAYQSGGQFVPPCPGVRFWSANRHIPITTAVAPAFLTPLQCTRERFQVNSIGRPILRSVNYNHLSTKTMRIYPIRR